MQQLPASVYSGVSWAVGGVVEFCKEVQHVIDVLYLSTSVSMSGVSDFFRNLSTDGRTAQTIHATYHITWSGVDGILADVPRMERDGEFHRPHCELGTCRLDATQWQDVPIKTIGLCMPSHHRAVVRPFMDRILETGSTRNWTRSQVDSAVHRFFAGRTRIDADAVSVLVARLLWKVHTGLDLSDEQLTEFVYIMGVALTAAIVPPYLQRDVVATYRRRMYPEIEREIRRDTGLFASIDPCDTELHRILSSAILDSLIFAGGLSIPTVITSCLAVLYSAHSPAPTMRHRLGRQNLEQFVFETIRLFPPVPDYPYYDPNGTRQLLSLQMALRDRRAWGASGDVDAFVLRDKAYYHRLMGVAWAHCTTVQTPMAAHPTRRCPAKDLSVACITSFFLHLLPEQTRWEVSGADRVRFGASVTGAVTLEKTAALGC